MWCAHIWQVGREKELDNLEYKYKIVYKEIGEKDNNKNNVVTYLLLQSYQPTNQQDGLVILYY